MVGRGQGCCLTSYNAQDVPPQEVIKHLCPLKFQIRKRPKCNQFGPSAFYLDCFQSLYFCPTMYCGFHFPSFLFLLHLSSMQKPELLCPQCRQRQRCYRATCSPGTDAPSLPGAVLLPCGRLISNDKIKHSPSWKPKNLLKKAKHKNHL